MKPNELMIGDWVEYRNTIQHWNSQIRNGSDIDANHTEYYPISTTTEILEKNGWRKYGLPFEWRRCVWVQRWIHNDIDISFDIHQAPKYDGFTWKGVEINEVHIFQRALRLYGLNDLADNFKV